MSRNSAEPFQMLHLPTLLLQSAYKNRSSSSKCDYDFLSRPFVNHNDVGELWYREGVDVAPP